MTHLNTALARFHRRLTDHQLWLLLLGLAAVLIFTGIGLRSPWPADEPRFAEIAREMVRSGHWLIPMRGGEFYPDKPPVFMWSIAFFYLITGNLKLAFLLPNALCGLATLALVNDLGRRLWNARTGLLAAFLLLLAPQFLIQAKNAQIDGMVACWITVACYGLIRHFFLKPAWGWYFLAWGFMGLGIITKGVGFLPALMLIPILIIGWLGHKGQLTTGSLRWRALAGPLVMLAVIVAWLLPMLWYVDQLNTPEALAYRDNILFKQTGERYANSWGHLQPWYYYLTSVIPTLWFPLPLLLLAAGKRGLMRLKSDPILITLLAWVVLVVVFFSISPGKRGVYVLPALPMFVLVLAALIEGRTMPRWFGLLVGAVQWLIGFALMTLGVLAWREYPQLVDKISDYSRSPDLLHTVGTFVFIVGLVWVSSALLLLRSTALIRLFTALAASWLLVSTWGYTLLEPLRTPRNVLMAAEQHTPKDATLGLLNFSEQLILFSRRDVVHFSYFSNNKERERNAWQWMAEGKDRYLLIEDNLDLACFTYQGAIPLGVAHREHYVLIGTGQRLPECAAPAQPVRYYTPSPGAWLATE